MIISQSGKFVEKVNRSGFDKEDYLQQYIHENPDSIPVYEIAEDKRLFVIAREFSTESGPIDALAVDKDGDIYIVETKLYKNPDKRTVVAQALDYGASLWKHVNDFSSFIADLDVETKKTFQLTFADKTKEFFSLDDEQSAALQEAMKRNLRDGNLKFVILMDAMDERLRDLIIYVNQNSQFDIFAVEMEFYKFKDYEIMIPKIFGVEVKKNITTSSSNSPRQKWDEQAFFEALKKQCDASYQPAVKKLYDFSKSNAEVKWGTGSARGSFNPVFAVINSRSVYSVWTDGKLSINFGWLGKDEQSETFRDELKRRVEKLGFIVPDNYREHFITYEPAVWTARLDEFTKIILELTNRS